jgi:hypothetical protein
MPRRCVLRTHELTGYSKRRPYVKKLAVLIAALFCCFVCVDDGSAQEEGIESQELLNRIEELEKRINELTEEGRARRKLEITEQEKQEKEKEVLEAVGREYSLDPKHTLNLDYSLSYSYSPSERITNQLLIEREIDHTIRHIISTTYSILDNLALSTSVPFVYRYNEVGTDEELDETDIGDISLGFLLQPIKSKAGEVRTILSFSAMLPSGRSPYKINPETELSTGNGVYAFVLNASFSKQIDPVVAFWNIGYTYRMDATGLDYRVLENYILEEVEAGDSVSVGAGLGYALSYKVSVNSSFSYTYQFSNTYHYRGASRTIESGDTAEATFGVGVGWRATNKTTLSFSLGYSLSGSGFSFTFRAPFSFVL